MARLGEKKVISATRSALKLESGEYGFEGAQFGMWDIPETKERPAAKIEYLALKTDKGVRGIPLGSLYNCTLSSESKTVGELIADYDDKINPIDNLSGTLIISKKGNDTNLKLKDVRLSELVDIV